MNRLTLHQETRHQIIEMLETVDLNLLPVEIEPKFITNLPKDQKGRYQRALWLCGLEDSYIFQTFAEDMSGNLLPEHLSLYRCNVVADAVIEGFWDTMQLLHNNANPLHDALPV